MVRTRIARLAASRERSTEEIRIRVSVQKQKAQPCLTVSFPMAPSLGGSFLLLLLPILLTGKPSHEFEITEATIDGIQDAFRRGELTSRALVEFYLARIQELNPVLRAVIEVNPDALRDADAADRKRRRSRLEGHELGAMHGIPVLLKDNIATKDKTNTTAGSLALLGSVVPRDAGVAERLRTAGAVLLGKASLSEWANFRSLNAPNGWSARGGQPKNPYNLSADPCGSSTGSAIAAAANMASVTLGSETSGSIICPSSSNSVVGIKPTVGLTSRSGVIPISPRRDSIGPICRTVSDAVRVMDAIVGYDPRDAEATRTASKFIPRGGYMQFLRADGLRGKRLAILRQFFNPSADPMTSQMFEKHFQLLRQKGAVILDNLEIANASIIQNIFLSGEAVALVAEFKIYINKYLMELTSSPVRSLQDVIDFNNKNKVEEKINEYGQSIFLAAQNTTGIGPRERAAIQLVSEFSNNGLEKLMKEKELDAVITPEANGAFLLSIGGYPGISVPAGYRGDGSPIGICFGGLRGSEPKLIEIAYGFEQATMVRKPPVFNVKGV